MGFDVGCVFMVANNNPLICGLISWGLAFPGGETPFDFSMKV